jgi:hypothetical protein
MFFFLLHASGPAFVVAALSPEIFNFFDIVQAASLPSNNRLLHCALGVFHAPAFACCTHRVPASRGGTCTAIVLPRHLCPLGLFQEMLSSLGVSPRF